MYTCRECEQPINQATEVCPYCGVDLSEASTDGDPGAGKPTTKSTRKIVLLFGFILSSLVAIAWFAVPWHVGGSKSESEAHAVGAIATLQQALNSYRSTEGAFPSSLEPLGAAARSASQQAQYARYTLQYAPGKPEADGRVKTYTLTARAGNYGYLNLFTDETGAIRGTRQDRAATAEDPQIGRDSPGPLFIATLLLLRLGIDLP